MVEYVTPTPTFSSPGGACLCVIGNTLSNTEYIMTGIQADSHCLGLVKILSVNRATLRLYKADDKQALYDRLENVFTDASVEVFREELIAMCDGKTRFESVMPARESKRR